MTVIRVRNYLRMRLVALIGLTIVTSIGLPVAEAQTTEALSGTLAAFVSNGAPGTLRVVMQGPQSEVDRLSAAYGLRVIKRLELGAVVEGTSQQLGAVSSDANAPILTLDDVVVSTMAVTTQSTGANQLWARDGSTSNFGGLTGSGVVVGVIDSGVAPHPDIAKRVKGWFDFTGDESGQVDGYGHGTHIASIIAGSGGGSRTAEGSAYVGMAPAAEIISLRVLDANGNGYVSDVIAAIELAIRRKDRYKLRVLNISLGHAPTARYQDDPMAKAVERAVAAGIVVVASAGNYGKTEDGTPIVGAVVSPGFTPGALTVGALNTRGTVARGDDAVATYSSRGPVGDPEVPSTWEIKPDLVAPGNAIVAAGTPGTYLWDNFPARQVIGENGGNYLTLSGSSMAAGVVSGAVAQLLQAQPALTPAAVKFLLQYSAEPLDGFGLIEQGAGSLNVLLAVAVAETVSSGDGLDAAPSAVSIDGAMAEAGGLAFLPAGDDDRVSTTVWGNTIIWGNRGGGVGGNTLTESSDL